MGRGKISQHSAVSGAHCCPISHLPGLPSDLHPFMLWVILPSLAAFVCMWGGTGKTGGHTGSKESSRTRHGLLGGLWLALGSSWHRSLGQVCEQNSIHCPAYPLSPHTLLLSPSALATCNLFASPVCAPVPERHHWHCAGHSL